MALGCSFQTWAGAALVAGFAAGAQAQEPLRARDAAAETTAREGVEVFERAFFDVYNPVTARDMVQRVPGFSIEGGGGGGGNFNGGGGQRRGFGANATNVLINGQRPSSKTSIDDQLGRIPADNVDRIELLRGAALADVDVRGQTQIANVVLLPGASVGAATTYIAELTLSSYDRVAYDLQATRAFRIRDADVTLDVRLPVDAGRGEQTETLVTSVGDVVEVRDEFNQEDRAELRLNGAASWAPTAGDLVNVNVELTPETGREDQFSDVVDALGNPVRTEFTTTEQTDSYDVETGADWERRLGESASFKILGLLTHRTQSRSQEERTFTPAGFDGADRLASDVTAGERILRGTLTMGAGPAHTLEAGLEGAFNFRDSLLDLRVASAPDGPFTTIFTDDVRVEELRGDAFVSDVWTLSPRLTIETGFTFEASRISQIRDGGEPFEREFTYPKPSLNASYRLANGDQLRFSVTRDVAQLDFGEFASSVNLSEDRQEAGNQELVPEQTWETRLAWERRFAARGVVTLEAFYDAVEDTQDRVPIVVAADSAVPIDLGDPTTFDVIDGAGNIGDGERYGLRADATFPLAPVGLPDGELRLRGRVQESEVVDPVTGATRQFSRSNDWDFNVDYRQDLPALGLALGARYGRDALRRLYRVNESLEFGPAEGFLDLYVESTQFMGVTMRFQISNAADTAFIRRRFLYVDPATGAGRPRDLGPPDQIEERIRRMRPFYSFRVSGTF